ncbi:trypsin-like peptidase domain-containing protein [Cellvibrio polysaccharolyticus]|uniref:PDZ domain-containing protein n=1 Tax=Cellvibrio polysaccharolyticus TaxID=2082724 RepID=A0A928V593_9GAMM|nr:trypsin-like peptidase domain-containing protein [Cellvibrio polysaccharolyticus]MBE8716852.1 PDZ domain-containing protein [Cellvibrio polysaccharolyticus]
MSLQRLLQFIGWPVVAGLLIATLALLLFPQLRPDTTDNTSPRTIPGAPVSYSEAVSKAAPSVVNIYTSKIVQRRNQSLADNPLYRHLFNNANTPQQVRMQSTLGSGVIVDDQGHILTNNHIIEGADEIQVLLNDGRETDAQVVGIDDETDLAVLKISLEAVSAIAFGDPSRARVGDVVLAIGNPYGVGQSVSQGIVSATGRYNLGTSFYENFIQTDAAINPGNSGGALIDAYGNLIGINTAVLDETGASIGIGFAVPIDMAMKSLNSIIQYGKVVRGSLGFTGSIVYFKSEFVARNNLNTGTALRVEHIEPRGPAHLAGIRPGDLITHLNQQPVGDGRQALNLIADTPPGDTLKVQLIRYNTMLEVDVIVGTRESGKTRT